MTEQVCPESTVPTTAGTGGAATAESTELATRAIGTTKGTATPRCGRRARQARRVVPALTRHPVPALFAVLLIAVQISYPLTEGPVRDRVTVAVVLLSAATALAHAAATRGTRFTAGFLAIVSGIGFLAEAVGTATGMPFGCYEYAVDRIGPALGAVPLIVPLAWTGGLYPVWIVATMLTRRAAGRIGLTAVGAVGWDLFLDPQMVADGQWTWCAEESGLPGLAQIPVTNYPGWFAVGLVMAALLERWDRAAPASATTIARTPAFSAATALPAAVFLWTWLGSVLAHAVFLGLPASAGYGALGMGALGLPLLLRLGRSRGGERESARSHRREPRRVAPPEHLGGAPRPE
ncbi:carotenoid biosynthesis protein [Nocardia sp. NPDC005366]|uniref:carotenoid biosynthesis protein n=1 Tax=Nocardia sp. NPDC005366 TaxID=3156878 RepID=UPI0033BB1B23